MKADVPGEGKADRRLVALDDNGIASSYLREAFEPGDRLAIVVISRRHGGMIQRIAPVERLAAEDCQRWLRYMNERAYEIYLTMNALKDSARGRTREDVAAVRHVYLDLDEGGEGALERLLAPSDLPKPNHVLTTSPGKYQIVWRVEGFSAGQAESLQRGLARETGADAAATGSSRVLRLPGFYDHGHEPPVLVRVERLSQQTHRPEDFPQYPERDTVPGAGATRPRVRRPGEPISQSERDWAYARRALARGEPRGTVIAAIASYRRFDTRRPEYYAALTVEKAERSLQYDDRAGAKEDQEKER